jgi:putative membrane protein
MQISKIHWHDASSIASAVQTQWMPDGWHMQGMHDWMSGWGAWSMLVPLMFWIVVIIGLALLVQKLLVDQKREPPESRALDVLSQRYAKGEIDREEYLRRRQDIIGA